MPNTPTTPRYPLYTPTAQSFARVVPFDESEDTPFSPSDIDTAYSLSSRPDDGSGVTIAVIGAFGAENLQDDFKDFGRMFGLPENSLEVYYANGDGTPNTNTGWDLEAHTATEWVYAAAPAARIICVFATDARMESLFSAVSLAISIGADVISMSFGSEEFRSQKQFTDLMKNSGRIFVASAGDTGGKVIFPSSSDAVVSVGGTVLHRTRRGNVFARSAWINGGGGASLYTPIPEWQEIFSGIEDLSGRYRATPDVSLNAATSPGYYVYSRREGGLVAVGGTSVSAPVFAGICARILQNNPSELEGKTMMQYLYEKAGRTFYSEPQYYFSDVTVGSNGVYTAMRGYDLCTGLGAPVGNMLISG